MSELSDALLGRLRGHVNDCGQHAWSGRCRPAQGRYCPAGRALYDAFHDARKAEVTAVMVERLAWVRSEAS